MYALPRVFGKDLKSVVELSERQIVVVYHGYEEHC